MASAESFNSLYFEVSIWKHVRGQMHLNQIWGTPKAHSYLLGFIRINLSKTVETIYSLSGM